MRPVIGGQHRSPRGRTGRETCQETRHIFCQGLNKGRQRRILRRHHGNRDAGESNLFLNSPSNPNISTRDALKRAQQLLGTDRADIRISYEPIKK